MSVPINIDEYQKYLPVDNDRLREMHVADHVIERVTRLRGINAFWLQFPNKTVNEVVQQDIAMFNIEKSQAYDDIRLVQIILGNLQSATKEFWRWKINSELDSDIRNARRDRDWRAVASMQKNRIKNNRTDSPDDLELEYDKIIPQNFEPTEDPSVLGIKRMPGLRDKIKQLNKKYAVDIEDAEYEEVEDDPTDK